MRPGQTFKWPTHLLRLNQRHCLLNSACRFHLVNLRHSSGKPEGPHRKSKSPRQVAQCKLQKAKDKAATLRKKEATKAAKELVKAQEDAAKAEARFTWTEEALLELLGFVKMVKDEHREKDRLPGFTAFGKFFLGYSDRKGAFPLLAKLENLTLLWRYRALMHLWRVSVLGDPGVTLLLWILTNQTKFLASEGFYRHIWQWRTVCWLTRVWSLPFGEIFCGWHHTYLQWLMIDC